MKTKIRARALVLRAEGKSIKHIARMLSVSTGSVSQWCKDVLLTDDQRAHLVQRQRIAAARALAPWIAKNQALKRDDMAFQRKLGIGDVGTLSRRDLLFFGLGLYWGEGYKRGSQEWGFTNSDPAIIRVILRWLDQCYQIKRDRIIARLTLNNHYRGLAASITNSWVKETTIPVGQFAAPTYITAYGKSNLDARTYRGTLRIKVRRGTSLRRRILASIERAAR